MQLPTVVAFLTILLFAPGWIVGQMLGPPSFDQSVARISFESVDFSPLRPWARQHSPDVSDEELDHRISVNLQFIFHNMLNQRHFIVAPQPEDVIAQIAQILEIVDELNGLLTRGHRMVAAETGPSRQLVQEIRKLAKRLHDDFTLYFTEGYRSVYRLDLRMSRDPTAQLASFLSESEAIARQLTDRTDDFFLSSVPGSMSLAQYQGPSISVLSASLERLADAVAKQLEAREAR